MHFLLSLLTAFVFVTASQGCSSRQKTPAQKVVADDVAYFAGGCFWGVEHFLQQLEGVVSVESGYSGGYKATPSYQEVVEKKTGHLETVRVKFDSKKVPFKAVAKRFFEIHDPTQGDGQGPDIGEQYLSAVFFTNAEQKADTQDLIAQLKNRGYNVATELRQFEHFWPAENYHQNYYAKNGKQPYCHARVKRFED